MPGNSFGQLFRITTFGESHGPALGVVIDGCPSGIAVSTEDIERELARRRPGQSTLTTMRAESDRPEILSGVFEGRTTGAPIAIVVRNEDARSRDYEKLRDVYRPGHADYTVEAKYGHVDPRGGGRASARETVARVAAAAIARKLLDEAAITVVGYTAQVGSIVASAIDPLVVTREDVDRHPVRCPDLERAKEMETLIHAMRKAGDSIGGIAEIVVRGCPVGLGEPVFEKLKAAFAHALLGIPAVVGFELGSGFRAATLRGSEHNDPFVPKAGGGITTETNRHGGILGGISSGEPILLRVCVKPTSSIAMPQRTVTRRGEAAEVRVGGRHDPCLLPRFIPIGEAMVTLVLADHLLRARALAPLSPGREGSSSGTGVPGSDTTSAE